MSDKRRPVRVRQWLLIVLLFLVWAVFNMVIGWDPFG